jgi:hypothetical protein
VLVARLGFYSLSEPALDFDANGDHRVTAKPVSGDGGTLARIPAFLVSR